MGRLILLMVGAGLLSGCLATPTPLNPAGSSFRDLELMLSPTARAQAEAQLRQQEEARLAGAAPGSAAYEEKMQEQQRQWMQQPELPPLEKVEPMGLEPRVPKSPEQRLAELEQAQRQKFEEETPVRQRRIDRAAQLAQSPETFDYQDTNAISVLNNSLIPCERVGYPGYYIISTDFLVGILEHLAGLDGGKYVIYTVRDRVIVDLALYNRGTKEIFNQKPYMALSNQGHLLWAEFSNQLVELMCQGWPGDYRLTESETRVRTGFARPQDRVSQEEPAEADTVSAVAAPPSREDKARLLEASAGIVVGSNVDDVVREHGMKCVTELCSVTTIEMTWAGVAHEVAVHREGDQVKEVVVSYFTGYFDELLDLMTKMYGAPKQDSVQSFAMNTIIYDWEDRAGLMKFSGRNIRGESLDKHFGLFVREPLP